MPCIVSLPTLSAPCSAKQGMGGIRAVYLIGKSSRSSIAQGEQSIGNVYIRAAVSRGNARHWGLVFSEAGVQDIETMTTSQIVAAITDGDTVTPFRRVATQRTGAVLESTIQASEDGVPYAEHVLTLPLSGLTPEASEYIYRLMGADVMAIVITWAGAWLGFGFDTPARLSGGGGTTGGGWGDAPGNSVQLTARSDGPLPVDPVLYSTKDEMVAATPSAAVKEIIRGSGIITDPN